jgi:hypothetical protein
MNDETFNLEDDNIISDDNANDNDNDNDNDNINNKEIIILDTYYIDKITAEVPYNQIHIGNWQSSCSMQDTSFWDNHFWNVFTQYSY